MRHLAAVMVFAPTCLLGCNETRVPTPENVGCYKRFVAITLRGVSDEVWERGEYVFRLTQGGTTESCLPRPIDDDGPRYRCEGQLSITRSLACSVENGSDTSSIGCDPDTPTGDIALGRRDGGDSYELAVTRVGGGIIFSSAGPLDFQCRTATCECSSAPISLTIDAPSASRRADPEDP